MRTLFHRAASVNVSDAEKRSNILEMLQHENLEQLVHHLVEGTMRDRELASTVLRGLTSNSDGSADAANPGPERRAAGERGIPVWVHLEH